MFADALVFLQGDKRVAGARPESAASFLGPNQPPEYRTVLLSEAPGGQLRAVIYQDRSGYYLVLDADPKVQAAIGKPLCDALNKERVKKGQEPVTSDEKDQVWPSCPGLDEATILVGSAGRKTFDRITVWYGPYVAGSYAEGAYELDFPMTRAMVAAVKPAYRGAFSAKQ